MPNLIRARTGMSATCRRSSAACATNAVPPTASSSGLEESRGMARPARSLKEALALASGLAVGFAVAPLLPGRKIWRTACSEVF